MRPFSLLLVFALTGLCRAQALPQPPEPPQTARQALVEMFTATKPDAFIKHLPDVTRKALLNGTDEQSSQILREFSMFSAGLAANRKQLQIFDVGPILLSAEEPHGQQKLEVMVERDDLSGDGDEIELSFRIYKGGQLEPLPVIPRLTFILKQEKEVWQLHEIALGLRLPLADPEFLKGLQTRQNQASESSAIGNLRTLNTAEISYAASYAERGFTCNISELDGVGYGDQATPEHAMLIDTNLASGKHNGYMFSISRCDVRPASKYQATAVPVSTDSGLRAFCSDESGVIRAAADGNAATCWSEGVPLQ